jgi:hypothetical protein
LKPDGRLFMSVFLFDEDAQTAVRNGTTIFNFAHPIGPSVTFDAEDGVLSLPQQPSPMAGLAS